MEELVELTNIDNPTDSRIQKVSLRTLLLLLFSSTTTSGLSLRASNYDQEDDSSCT